MAANPADRRRSGRFLLITGATIMVLAVGFLLVLTSTERDNGSPTPTSATSTAPTASEAPTATTGPSSEPLDPTASAPTQQPPDVPVAQGRPSVLGEITALIGALTGFILAVTGLIQLLRSRRAPQKPV
jgi:hypothetical protein